MLAGMFVQVDQFGCYFCSGDCGIDYEFGFGYESNDRAVVIGIRLVIEQDGSGHGFDGGDNLVDDF
jgi:hypothetical protein